MKIKVILFILFAVVATRTYGQDADTLKKLDPKLLREDFRLFRDTLQALHGGLYRFKSKEQMDELFDRGYAKLNDSMTFRQYFNIVSFITANIEDGHTKCRLPASMEQFFSTRAMFFPIQLRFIGQKAYVPCETKDFRAATEILAINGQPVNTIRENLFSYMTSDGSIQSEKYWKINQADNKFYWMYYLVYGPKKSFEVEYLVAGKKVAKTLPAVLYKEMQCLPAYHRDSVFLKFDILPREIALMTVKTFYNDFLKGGQKEFSDFLSSSFKELQEKHVQKLIIDVRSNGGGNDSNGALLFSYLTDKPFPYYASLRSIKRIFTVKDHSGLGIQQPSANNFKGKVYILTNGKSFSATSEFTAIARSNNRAIFIGEETGGGYSGDTSGPRKEVFLPNTGIEIDIPENRYETAVKKTGPDDRGTIPDHIVIPTINDYLLQRDVQLNYALKLAGQ